MAMLGGTFWPIKIVTNDIMLALAKTTPIFYSVEAMRGAIVFDASVMDILQPISILLLMGVLFIGIGLNLMERIK